VPRGEPSGIRDDHGGQVDLPLLEHLDGRPRRRVDELDLEVRGLGRVRAQELGDAVPHEHRHGREGHRPCGPGAEPSQGRHDVVDVTEHA
jgi:hypothetical protein